jgi:S-adenosylmethionine:tRNA ribosyltransferase-isomerase
MKHPKTIAISDYTYELPDNKIAQFPLRERDASKLLVFKSNKIEDATYKMLPIYLPKGALMVLNETKVVPARLIFHKSTGAKIEIFCLEPTAAYPDMQVALGQKNEVYWKCMIGGANKWKGDEILIAKTENGIILEAKKINFDTDSFVIYFKWSDSTVSFAEILEIFGAIPLPPYMNRAAESDDTTTYQTVFAKYEGSVAAPTAGLHFTKKLFHELELNQIEVKKITLHVGAGTFKQVKTASLEEHHMHAEWIDVPINIILDLINNSDIIAVGTTVMRTLESLYWIGVKLLLNKNVEWNQIALNQWEVYELEDHFSKKDALQALHQYAIKNNWDRIVTKTQILIAPPYNPKVINYLVTNFHQPQSTLLLLISSIVGKNWQKIYQHALINDYRFLSYGDGCLLAVEK